MPSVFKSVSKGLINSSMYKRLVKGFVFVLFVAGVLFFINKNFIEKEILPKEYIFISFTFILGIISLFSNCQSIRVDWLTIILFFFILYLILISTFTSPAILGILSLISFLFRLSSKSLGICI